MQAKRTKEVTLTFSRADLLYDIENNAFVEGDVMSDDSEHLRHQVIDIGQDGNVDRITRVLDLAHAECVEFMYPYTKVPCADTNTLNNTFSETEVYTIKMLVQEDFSQTTLNLVSKLVHEYMVCRALAEWLRITKPGNDSGWQQQAETIKVEIKTRLNARIGRIRRTQTPF